MIKKESGQAMVEFALTFAIAVVVLFGIIDFAWVCATRLQAENAVEEAARAVIVADNADRQAVGESIVTQRASLLVSPTVSVSSSADTVKVTLDGRIRILTPIGMLFPSGFKNLHCECIRSSTLSY